MERRQLLGWFVKGVGLTVGGVIAVPAVITAVSPAIRPRRTELWIALGPLEQFPIGEVSTVTIAVPRAAPNRTPIEKSIYILRRGAGAGEAGEVGEEITVYSRTCTDLSCPLTWDPGSKWFYCPCHGGIFDMEGEPRAGPPKRPMYRYANRINQNILEIDLNSVPVIA